MSYGYDANQNTPTAKIPATSADPPIPRAAALALGHALPDLALSDSFAPVGSLSQLRGHVAIIVLHNTQGFNPADHELWARGGTWHPELKVGEESVPGMAFTGGWYHEGSERFALLTNASLQPEGRALLADPGCSAVLVVDEQGILIWRHTTPAGVALHPGHIEAGLDAALHDGMPNTESGSPLHDGSSTLESDNSALSDQASVATGISASLRLNRRQWLAATVGISLLLAETPAVALRGAPSPPPSPEQIPAMAAAGGTIRLMVNGAAHDVGIDPRVSLLDALRERIGLTGTKKGCDHGQCGACTVLVAGQRVNACLTLAVMCQGKAITTIEGLARGDALHPMQASFLEHDGLQCGFCTPGQIMSAVGLLQEPCGAGDAAVRECMSGNLCRCGAYPNIVAAIQAVRRDRQLPGTGGKHAAL